MVGRRLPFLLGCLIFRGELLVSGRVSGCHPSENNGFFLPVAMSIWFTVLWEFLLTPFFRITVTKSSFPLPPAVELHLRTIVEQELVGNSLPHDVPSPSQRIKSPPRLLLTIKLAVMRVLIQMFNSFGGLKLRDTDIN